MNPAKDEVRSRYFCCRGKHFAGTVVSTSGALINAHRIGIHQLICPDYLLIELGNVLTIAERKGILPFDQSFQKLVEFLTIRPVIYPSIRIVSGAIRMASRRPVSVYDCMFLKLAQEENCELVTLDTKLIAALPGEPIKHLKDI